MGGSSGGFGQALVNSGMRMGGQAPAQGGAQYTEAPTRATYQPAFSSQQSGSPIMNHMVQPTADIKPVTADIKPNFTPMPIMANDPLSQFGDKPPIPALPQQRAPQRMMPQAPQGLQGLQGLMSQMMSRYQNPYQMMQRAPMAQYRSSALNYRPDIAGAQQNLGRVAKSVILQQKEAAEAELAAMRAAQAAEQNNSYYSGGG